MLDIKLTSHEAKPRITLMTIITICLIASLSLIAIKLARDVQEKETLGFDKNILLAIHSHATPFLNSFVMHTTDIGSPLYSALAAFVIGLVLAYRKQLYRFLVLGGSMVGAAGLAFIIKSVIERPRPDLWHHRLIHETGFSFISGHATMSMALAAALVALLWRTKWRWWSIGLGIIYVVYVGFSRLYLGAHYPTDVLGGWIVAFAWVLIVVLTFHLLLTEKQRYPRKKS